MNTAAHMYAKGPCEVCGEDSEDSPYWLGTYSIVHKGHVVQVFSKAYCKPLCSAECSLQWHETYGSYGDD
jgi:hypothetical protein